MVYNQVIRKAAESALNNNSNFPRHASMKIYEVKSILLGVDKSDLPSLASQRRRKLRANGLLILTKRKA